MEKKLSVEELDVLVLNNKVDQDLTVEDYRAWLGGDYETDDDVLLVEKFDKAVIKFLGKEVYKEFDDLARLDYKLRYELGLGKRFIGGIDLK